MASADVTVNPTSKELQSPNPLYLGNGAQVIANAGSTVDLRNATVLLPSEPSTVPNVVSVATIAALRGTVVAGLPNGAYVTVNGYGAARDGGGGIFIYDSSSSATDDGGTIIAPTIGSGRWLRAAAIGKMRPEWFASNAVPGTTDMSNAFAAARDAALAAGFSTIELRCKAYYLGTIVTFSTANQFWRITGLSGAGWLGNPKGTTISGPASGAMEAFFKFSATLQSIEIDHIAFVGGSTSTGVVSAIKNTGEGGPGRPVNIHNCQFYQHARAISSVLAGGGTNTGICQVNVRENSFFGCTYSLYGAGDIGALMDVNFEGNVSEQGGAILTLNNSAGGTWRIVSNIFEGQADAVIISGGLCHLIFESNYFEGNTGYILKFACSNGSSDVRVAGNFYTNTANARFKFDNVGVDNRDQIFSNGYIEMAGCSRNSFIGQNRIYPTDYTSDSSYINQLDPRTVQGSQFDEAAVGGVLKIVNPGVFQPGPLGDRSVENFTQFSSIFTCTGSLSAGDWVIVTALVRQRNSTAATIAVVIYDNTTSYLNESAAISPFPPSGNDGQWRLIHAAVKVPAGSTGNYKVRFATPASGQASVADFHTYSLTIANNTTPIYAYLPAPGNAGIATIPNGNTSVVVAHGLGYAPTSFALTPSANLGALWVDTIGTTNFTIHCGTAASGDQTVSWSAK